MPEAFENPSLTVLGALPPAWLDLDAADLGHTLDGPVLVHLDGEDGAPLFVSTLLHGNETSGWEALRRWLKRGPRLPRPMSLFIGNVFAAREGVRRFDAQPDYNRVWSLTPHPDLAECAETRLAREVLDEMRCRGVFAAIDIHNTTGRNPHYSIVHALDAATLGITQFFARRVLFADAQQFSLSQAFANLCPAMTLECGRPGEASGISAVESFLQSCVRLEALPSGEDAELVDELAVYRISAQINVAPSLSIAFGDNGGEVRFEEEIDRHNFHEIEIGTRLARLSDGIDHPLHMSTGEEARYFEVRDDALYTVCPLTPVMLTTDPRIVRQDCLCYALEVIDL